MPVNYNRIKRWNEKESIDIEYDTLSAALVRIQDAISIYGEKAEIRRVNDRYDDTDWLAIHVEEDETDDEMARRIAQEEIQENTRTAYERKQYEELKKKFEK